MRLSQLPELKERSVCQLGQIVPGNGGENILQAVPLAEFVDLPAMQIQMSDATVLLNVIQPAQKLFLPIRRAAVGPHEIQYALEIAFHNRMAKLDRGTVGIGMGAHTPEIRIPGKRVQVEERGARAVEACILH